MARRNESNVLARPPWELGLDGWRAIARRVWHQRAEDDVSARAAAVAFSAMFAIPTLLIAIVSIYGIVSSPEDVVDVVSTEDSVVPDAATDLLSSQLESIAGQHRGALSLGVFLGVVTAIWSVSGGVNRLRESVNEVYGHDDDRPWYVKRVWAAVASLGVIGAIIASVVLIGMLPAVLAWLEIEGWVNLALSLGRWLVLFMLMLGLLGALYRLGPEGEADYRPWVPIGSFLAVVAWLVMSIGFGMYVQNFGSYNETYGSLGSVIVFMMWLYLSAYIVLMAGEVNSEVARQWSNRDERESPADAGDRQVGATI